MTAEDLPMPYRYYLSLDRASSLKLGIEGSGEAVNSERADLATKLLEEYHRIDNDAYASAHWMSEPHTAKPFGIDLIIKHQGDVEAAVQDDELRDAVRDDLGYSPREELIDDEDGQRWTWFDGGRDDPTIQAVIDIAVIELKSQLQGGTREATPPAIADRWTRYSEAFPETAETDRDRAIGTGENLATRYDNDQATSSRRDG